VTEASARIAAAVSAKVSFTVQPHSVCRAVVSSVARSVTVDNSDMYVCWLKGLVCPHTFDARLRL